MRVPPRRTNGSPDEVIRHLCKECGYAEADAKKIVPKGKNFVDSPRSALTPEGFRAFNALVKREFSSDSDRALRAVLLLLPRTGLRVAEICGLRQRNLVSEGGRVGWKFAGKGSKVRFVPLFIKAGRIFTEYVQSVDLGTDPGMPIFPSRNHTPLSSKRVQDACKHLRGLDPSLRHLTPHVLRHTWATMALLHCWDLKTVQKLLGHGKNTSIKIPTVMLGYLHPDVLENR